MNKICFGCGAKLQSDDKEKVGYVPLSKIESAVYCMRCFRMINYGENKEVSTPKEAKEIINKINKDVKFVIFLVDFLNLNNSVINLFKSIKKEKMLVVNKCELLPKHIKKERLLTYISSYYNVSDPIMLKGGNHSHGATSVASFLEKNNIKNAYILGISNAGKSTLINDLLDAYDSNLKKIAVNKKANTTLDFIRVNISDNLTLIDSPGFILENSLNNDVTGKSITAYNFNIKECDTLGIIDNKYFLKFDRETQAILYTNSVADRVVKKYFKAAPGLKHTIEILEPNMDIVIHGIGFVTIKKPVIITTNIDPKYIEVRSSMFGGTYE